MEKLSESIHQKEGRPAPKRVFVEIGTKYSPATFLGRRKFGENDTYVGFDRDVLSLREGKNTTDNLVAERHGKNVFFVAGNGETMPLKEASADELYFGNVFGDPRTSEGSKAKLLAEAHRILRDSGTLIIQETYTPEVAGDMETLLRMHGFEVETTLKDTDETWESQMRKYHTPGSRQKYTNSYLLHAKKITY